jgi:hypothetical protein
MTVVTNLFTLLVTTGLLMDIGNQKIKKTKNKKRLAVRYLTFVLEDLFIVSVKIHPST